jgi:hypothetical protein
MQHDNQSLEKYLSDVPPVPESLLKGIEARIARRTIMIRSFYVSAASVFLAGFVFFFGITTNREPQSAIKALPSLQTETALKNEINDELKTAYEFINGSNIESEINEYAFADNIIF